MASQIAVTVLTVLNLIEEITGLKLGLSQQGIEEILSVLTLIAVWLIPNWTVISARRRPEA